MQQQSQGSWLGRILIWSSVIAILAFVGLKVNDSLASKSAMTTPVRMVNSGSELTAVRAQTVEVRTVEEYIALAGTLEPAYRVDVVARRSGRLKQVNVQAGERVKARQVLGVVEHEELLVQQKQMEANLTSSKAGLRRVELQLEKAQTDYNRVKKLVEKKAATEQELTNARNQLREAEVSLEVSQAQLEQVMANYEMLKLQLQQVEIDCPVDGVLLSSSLTVGSQVGSSGPVAQVAGLDPIEVLFYLPERDIGKIYVGQPLSLSIDAFPEQKYTGRVSFLDTTVDPQTRMIQVRGQISNSELNLRPGMYARVELLIDKAEGLPAVPRESLLTSADGFYVYLVKDSRAHQQLIQVGAEGREFVSVLSGLNVGDAVVTVGQQDLRDGEAVQLIESGDTAIRGGSR